MNGLVLFVDKPSFQPHFKGIISQVITYENRLDKFILQSIEDYNEN